MSKTIKIFSIFLVIFSLLISCYSVYASDINMNLQSNPASSTTNTTTMNQVISGDSQPQSPIDNDSYTEPSSVSSVAEEGLGLSSILSIFLITIGVVLILLAIAIIIRLK